jgi:3-deoxy-D-manno-octulosonic-acid transferase
LKAITNRALQFVDLFLVQTKLDQERLCGLGAPAERVIVMGSAKYDVVKADPDAEKRARGIMESAGFGIEDLILLGGSTWPGEERILLNIYKNLKPEITNLKLVLVPRHAERRTEVEVDIAGFGLKHTRRSELGNAGVELRDILLVDTTGELKDLYSVASVIFVGKSLCSTGGQNIIEPALPGKPIVVGPHLENFPDVAKDFIEAKAMIQVTDADELEVILKKMLESSRLRAEYGDRARFLIPEKCGVVDASVEKILFYMQDDIN